MTVQGFDRRSAGKSLRFSSVRSPRPLLRQGRGHLRLCSDRENEALPDETRVRLLDEIWQPAVADLKAVRQLQRNLVTQLSPLVPYVRRK